MDWFTADPHYGHEKIIGYCERPFVSLEHMDETLISNHNSRVDHGDEVWMVGDFTMRDPQPYLKRLRGRIHLIQGNHDKPRKWATSQFASCCWVKNLVVEGQEIILRHIPLPLWEGEPKVWHLFGHCHGKHFVPVCKPMLDVGVDVNNFKPISFAEVKIRIEERLQS